MIFGKYVNTPKQSQLRFKGSHKASYPHSFLAKRVRSGQIRVIRRISLLVKKLACVFSCVFSLVYLCPESEKFSLFYMLGLCASKIFPEKGVFWTPGNAEFCISHRAKYCFTVFLEKGWLCISRASAYRYFSRLWESRVWRWFSLLVFLCHVKKHGIALDCSVRTMGHIRIETRNWCWRKINLVYLATVAS